GASQRSHGISLAAAWSVSPSRASKRVNRSSTRTAVRSSRFARHASARVPSKRTPPTWRSSFASFRARASSCSTGSTPRAQVTKKTLRSGGIVLGRYTKRLASRVALPPDTRRRRAPGDDRRRALPSLRALRRLLVPRSALRGGARGEGGRLRPRGGGAARSRRRRAAPSDRRARAALLPDLAQGAL